MWRQERALREWGGKVAMTEMQYKIIINYNILECTLEDNAVKVEGCPHFNSQVCKYFYGEGGLRLGKSHRIFGTNKFYIFTWVVTR